VTRECDVFVFLFHCGQKLGIHNAVPLFLDGLPGGDGGTGEVALVGALIGAVLFTVLAVVCCVVTCRVLHNKAARQRRPAAAITRRRQ